jgi:uncharacterized protein (TIGR03067 family)
VIRALFATLFAAGVGLVGAAQEKAPVKTLEKAPHPSPVLQGDTIPLPLEGDYNLEGITRDGLSPPEAEMPALRESAIHIIGGRIVAADRDGKVYLDATLPPDVRNVGAPGGIELKVNWPKGPPTAGILMKDGARLIIGFGPTLLIPTGWPTVPGFVYQFVWGPGHTVLALRTQPFEGGYSITAIERDGKPLPPERFRDAFFRIKDGKIVGTDRDRHEFLYAPYTLNMNKLPWTVELKLAGPREVTTTGLVKRVNGALTIIYALPGGPPPTGFKTVPGQVMFTLRPFLADPLKLPNRFADSL